MPAVARETKEGSGATTSSPCEDSPLPYQGGTATVLTTRFIFYKITRSPSSDVNNTAKLNRVCNQVFQNIYTGLKKIFWRNGIRILSCLLSQEEAGLMMRRNLKLQPGTLENIYCKWFQSRHNPCLNSVYSVTSDGTIYQPQFFPHCVHSTPCL